MLNRSTIDYIIDFLKTKNLQNLLLCSLKMVIEYKEFENYNK